jgi:capsular exopolysaccharide synthesis family protein
LGAKVSPQRRIILPVGALAGMMLGCMLAFVVDVRDDSFQSCEQVQQQLGLPVVGQIPQFAPASLNKLTADTSSRGKLLDPMLCAYHSPRTLPAEAFRTLRTAIFFNGHGKLSRVIQVTGARAEDGASTVAANLATSLAQTGKRVLLIDADLREQKQHQVLGMAPPETGLAAIIASDVEPADAICQTSIDNLSLLTLGRLPDGPCELFTSPRFEEFISLMRDSYDHVLIDTDPLLTASDPFLIAPHTDGVLLVLRLGRDERRKAKQAKQMMDRLDVSILGIVVNRMSDAILSQRPSHRQRQPVAADVPKSSVSSNSLA